MKRVSKSVASTRNKNNREIIENVRRAIESHRLLSYADHVLVGLSGGPDSMALLNVLLSIRHDLGIKVSAAHFNHGIRRDADRDERFVRGQAEKLQIPMICQRAPGKPPSHGSLEGWARQERYKFFKKAACQAKAGAVALGHTADDLAETVLMRLIRGAGLQGLVGMEPKRTMGDCSIIRPFLGISKKDVYAYLEAAGISYCIDQTNFQTDFTRNKIRLELLPYLIKDYNPNIMQVFANLSNTAGVDYSFLQDRAHEIWQKHVRVQRGSVQMNLVSARQWHPAMRRMVIRMSYEALKGDLNQLSFDHVLAVDNILFNNVDHVELPAGIAVCKRKQTVVFSASHQTLS